jgi:ADP-heptose:LPS heptosyltransferase
MAETWRVTPLKRLLLRAIDVIGRPLAGLLLQRPRERGEGIWKILVLEPWHIGDVVIATTALQALRARYPDAWISLLAKPHAEEILHGSGLVDEIITFDFPWTAETGKYRLDRYDRAAFSALFRRLRDERFDLTVDCRMDLRSNVVSFATRAGRRVGYDFGGGSFLLSDAIPASPRAHHKVEDWLKLMEALGSRRGAHAITRSKDGRQIAPRLTLLPEERDEAALRLETMGIARQDLIVGIHAGASSPEKRWPPERFAAVADYLAEIYGARIVVLVDPGGHGAHLPLRTKACYLTPSLRQLMAYIGSCDVLICNDSAPMHIADALGVPVVAVFTSGNPKWYGPSGEYQRVVGQGAPRGKAVDVPVVEVLEAAEEQIERAIAARARIGGSSVFPVETASQH